MGEDLIKIVDQNTNRSRICVKVGTLYLYFSYDTCVAVSDTSKHWRFRCVENHSNTTSAHMRQFGVYQWERVPDIGEAMVKCLSGGDRDE